MNLTTRSTIVSQKETQDVKKAQYSSQAPITSSSIQIRTQVWVAPKPALIPLNHNASIVLYLPTGTGGLAQKQRGRGRQKRLARIMASVPTTSRGRREKQEQCPSFLATPPGQKPRLLCSANTGKPQLQQAESSGCFLFPYIRGEKMGLRLADHLSFCLIIFLHCHKIVFSLWTQKIMCYYQLSTQDVPTRIHILAQK